MNVLFLTLLGFNSLKERGIYTDLLREFVKNGHQIYAISPVEKRQQQDTHIIEEDNTKILRLKIGNTQKTNIIEKGISTVMIGPTFKKAIKKYFSDVKFDLILYSTPPITLIGAIGYVKKRYNAQTYLLLKDIFPQNAIDIGMMSKTGIKGILYRHFRKLEKKLYALSDRIGCMSRANVEYVINHNPELKERNDQSLKTNDKPIVEECPNSIEPKDLSISLEERRRLREKYKLPQDKLVFVYGGNLGKPQGIPFMLECINSQKENDKLFFLIVGSGTEYYLIEEYVNTEKPKNMVLYKALPKEDYDMLVAACDVGLIFLDYRFTIPNFPSRLLSYMQAKIPIFAITDSNTDIGNIITGINKEGNKTHETFGWWCGSNDAIFFNDKIEEIIKSDNLSIIGKNGYKYLEDHYSAEDGHRIIMRNFLFS